MGNTNSNSKKSNDEIDKEDIVAFMRENGFRCLLELKDNAINELTKLDELAVVFLMELAECLDNDNEKILSLGKKCLEQNISKDEKQSIKSELFKATLNEQLKTNTKEKKLLPTSPSNSSKLVSPTYKEIQINTKKELPDNSKYIVLFEKLNTVAVTIWANLCDQYSIQSDKPIVLSVDSLVKKGDSDFFKKLSGGAGDRDSCQIDSSSLFVKK